MEEDELAVHTVVSASYGLLKDIKKKQGRNEAADIYHASFFYLVRDFRRGTLPTQFTSDFAKAVEIQRIADQLPQITADSKLSDMTVKVSSVLEKQYWNETNKVANFLKHANRDGDGTLSLGQIDIKVMLLKCYSAYRDVGPDDLGNEGLVFGVFAAARNPAHRETGTAFDSLVELIKRMPDDQRLGFCYKLIVEMNAS